MILSVNIAECPALQRACNDVASIVGYYGHVFEAACHVHQMCLLCVSIKIVVKNVLVLKLGNYRATTAGFHLQDNATPSF